MNDKDETLDYLPNEVLHENTPLSPYDRPTLDNDNIHPITSTSKRTLISSPGDRKPSKHIFSPPPEAFDEASNLVSKRILRDSSTRALDQGINYNIEASSASTYALQIALKNMKERYQKLQKKITVLEDENGRLINGKSDLFSEIGKMQESSIKLREKNLQLNHEVHSKHQECCSLQEQFSAVSTENLSLCSQLSQSTNEKKKLTKEVEEMTKENATLKEGLQEILTHCRRYSTIQPEILTQIERIANKSLKRNPFEYVAKTKIIPESEDFENLDDFEKITLPSSDEEEEEEDDLSLASFAAWETSKDGEALSVEACLKAKDAFKKFAAVLQKQNQQLTELKPFITKVSKRKFDSSDLVDDSGDPCRNYLSRFATCGSGLRPSEINLSSDEQRDGAINDSGGETNVLVEEMEETGRKVPFDWRKVEVSDDEGTDGLVISRGGSTAGAGGPRPSTLETRTVSTSPDLTLTFDLAGVRRCNLEEEERTCPMCNAVFPLVLPQETFESHVVSHFEVENGFEVIT